MDELDRYNLGSLYYAALAGHDDAVALLLERGAAIDRFGVDGHTALWGACKDNHLSTVQLLLAQGAEVNVHRFQLTVRKHPAATIAELD